MPAKTIVVKETFTKSDGSPAVGSVTFTPSVYVVDLVDDQTVAPTPLTVQLDADGGMLVALTATTGSDVDPTGWVWYVAESLLAMRNRPVYAIALPADGPNPLFLHDLAPVPDFDAVVYGPEFGTVFDGGTP